MRLLLASVGAIALLAAGAVSAQPAVDSVFPVRVVDRPTTLPRGASRLDLIGIVMRQPDSPTAVTAILGGGVGVANALEVGGQVLPVSLAPGEPTFTNASLYVTYAFDIGSVSGALMLQGVLPLRTDDPFFVDVGVPLSYTFGTLGSVAVAPMLSVDTRQNGAGTSLSLPVTFMWQASDRLGWLLSSGVGFSRFDPRFGLSRRTEAFEFDDLTIALSAEVLYTLVHGSPRRPLADLTLQVLWPQLYTRFDGQEGSHVDDWSVQLQTSWYAIP